MTGIAVLGAGAFGTALAISLASSGKSVTLIARNSAQLSDMMETRSNSARLPGCTFPKNLAVAEEIPQDCDIVLVAIPTQKAAAALSAKAALLREKTLVACFKGIELKTGRTATALIQDACSCQDIAILSGPSFAADIARGMPTALTLAAQTAEQAEDLQHVLTTNNLRLYRTTDVQGVELGGALKNVVAIAAGLAIGAGLGESARAALITRGFAEMSRFAVSQGADQRTLAGLSGFGDLVLTCTSEKSRNYSFGISLGRGEVFDANVTVEGAATARIVSKIAKDVGQDMPIATLIGAILSGKTTVEEAQGILLSRPLRKE